jgi:hypothetical protein
VAQSKLSQAPVLAQNPRAIGLNSALHDFKKAVLYLTEIVENISRFLCLFEETSARALGRFCKR